MILSELISKICDADGTYRLVYTGMDTASEEYGIIEIAELQESIRAARH